MTYFLKNSHFCTTGMGNGKIIFYNISTNSKNYSPIHNFLDMISTGLEKSGIWKVGQEICK